MDKIYEHHLPESADNGVFVRELNGLQAECMPLGVHMDNYFLFIFVDSGWISVCVDFHEGKLNAHTCGFLEPGKVHQYRELSSDVHGYIMGVDSILLSDTVQTTLSEFTFRKSKFVIDERHEQELGMLFPLLMNRRSKESAPAFAHPIIAIFTEIAKAAEREESCSRVMDVFLKFRALVKENLRREHKPSFYAEKLNITSGYLNEIVNHVMYVSTQKYILSELVLQARRDLATSSLSIQQVAERLGYDDAAYFSRIFSRISGESPQVFRKRFRIR